MSEKRFKKIHYENIMERHSKTEIVKSVEIIQDSCTGVLYGAFHVIGASQMSIIPLIDADGKPLVEKLD